MISVILQYEVSGVLLGAALLLLIIVLILFRASLKIVKEKEVMIIERSGDFHTVLTAGIHFIIPFFDTPKVNHKLQL
jgi:regulator of protease activity HflC (stomatin/prohibitin superfamily)